MARKAIELALKGDGPLMRALLPYVLPRPKDPPAPVGPLPMGSMEEVVATFNSVLEKISAGELSPEQGQAVINLIDARCRLFQAHEFDQRLKRVEQIFAKNPAQGGPTPK